MNINSFMHFQVGLEVVQVGPDLVQPGIWGWTTSLLVQGQPRVSSTVVLLMKQNLGKFGFIKLFSYPVILDLKDLVWSASTERNFFSVKNKR